jgi:hypothetical protein
VSDFEIHFAISCIAKGAMRDDISLSRIYGKHLEGVHESSNWIDTPVEAEIGIGRAELEMSIRARLSCIGHI